MKQRHEISAGRADNPQESGQGIQGAGCPSLCELIFQSLPDAVIVTGPGDLICGWNNAAEQLLGWAAQDVVGFGIGDILPALRCGTQQARASIATTGRAGMDALLTARDGRPVAVRCVLSPMARSAGAAGGVVWTLRDEGPAALDTPIVRQAGELGDARKFISKGLNALDRLHEICTHLAQKGRSTNLLDEIVSATVDITGADGCILMVDSTHREKMKVVAHSGFSRQFIARVAEAHEKPAIRDAALELQSRLVIEDIRKCPMPMGEKELEALEEAGIRSMQCTPLFSQSGRVVGMFSTHRGTAGPFSEIDLKLVDLLARIATDTMERSASEDRVRRSNSRIELLYDVVDQLLQGEPSQTLIQKICEEVMLFLRCGVFFNYMLTDDRRVLRLNACAGISDGQKRELMYLSPGQAVCGWVAQNGSRCVVEEIQCSSDERVSYLKTIGIRVYACHPLVVGDETFGTLAFGSMDRDSFTAGELALMKAVAGHAAVAVNRMRTKENLERMAEELSDKNKLVTDFFTNISHEFKTPLSIILVNLQLMDYRLRDSDGELQDKFRKVCAVMRQNALRLLRLIGNLLDVTKIDAGFMKVRLCSANAVDVVRNLVESVGDFAGSAGINVGFESSSVSIVMPLDGEKMERIMLNLLSNAIKHTPAGGRILVRLTERQGSVLISVRDSGEGIPPEKQDFIFDRFRQVNTSLTRSNEGCGIGLSLCKALVGLLQGRIWFSSSPGWGSEFYVELPVLKDNTPAHTAEIETMPLSRKLEMEFSDINRIGARQ